MEGLELYYFPPSPPCRAVLLFLRVLGLAVNLKQVDISKGEQLKPEFLQLNPQHTIPTLVDNDFVLWESRAILKYLDEQYDKDHKYLPKNSKLAAKVDHLMDFDIGTLYQRFLEYFKPIMEESTTKASDPENTEKVKEALGYLDYFLEKNEWVAGHQMTIADFSIVATVSSIEAVGFNISQHRHVSAWYENIKKVLEPYGYQEINQKGANVFKEIVASKTQKKTIN